MVWYGTVLYRSCIGSCADTSPFRDMMSTAVLLVHVCRNLGEENSGKLGATGGITIAIVAQEEVIRTKFPLTYILKVIYKQKQELNKVLKVHVRG